MVVCMPDVPLPVESQATYTVATVAMQLRFKTKSRMPCYGAEFDAHKKNHTESWTYIADNLLSLAKKAYPDFQAEVRECLVL